ncbi:MAG: LysM peptidoglycan-binding domain-containing protein, partial [Burkholderiales bacterium]
MKSRVLRGEVPLGNPPASGWRPAVWIGLAVAVALTAGCTTRRVSVPAPVEDRLPARGAEVPATAATTPAAPAGAENAGKPGFYTVKPGDTLYRIALDHGQSWRDVQAWNNIANPSALEVGQVLRVQPPADGAAGSASVTAVATPGVVARPLG